MREQFPPYKQADLLLWLQRKHTPADTTTSGSGADSDSGSEASVGAALPAQLITVQQRVSSRLSPHAAVGAAFACMQRL